MMRWFAPLVVLVLAGPTPRAAADGILDEMEFGVLAHDVPIGDQRRETGADASAEVRFVSPDFLAAILAPRPHLGLDVNSAGGNSYAYAGLTWTANFTPVFFANLGLGGAVHDGPDDSTSETHKGLGTRALFHEYVELGAHLAAPWSTSLFLDHVSNADLGRHNPGLSNLGLRVGYAF
jgi:lipid A 3-O-deacylase